MAEQAKVTSIEALELFRAELIIFADKAHCSLDEVGDEVRRTRAWLQNDQRTRWEGEIRRRKRVLDQAEQELLSAKLSNLRENISAQQNAVRKARSALAEAEEKLRCVKRWNRDFEQTAEVLVRRFEGLRHYLNHDLMKAISFLLQAQRTLEAYAETGAPPPPSPTPA